MALTSRNGGHRTTIRRAAPVSSVLLVTRAKQLERHLPPAIGGQTAAVHQARVASRRLREALPVMARASGRRRKAQKRIRRITRALGRVREMDVTLGILDELARRSDIPRDALEDVRGHVVAERECRREVMLERLDGFKPGKLTRRVEEVARVLPEDEPHPWQESLATRLRRRARRLGSAVEEAGRIYAPEGLHQVRIAAKKLRYGLELAVDARLAPARPLLAVLKRTQDTLGRVHDLQIIQQHVASVQTRPPRGGASSGGHDVIARVLEKECRHLHAQYTSTVPALLEVVSACRAGIFTPVTVQPARTRRRPRSSHGPATPP